MDLDTAKSADQGAPNWARVGMFVCFAVAAGILIVSIWMPTAAKSNPIGSTIHRPA